MAVPLHQAWASQAAGPATGQDSQKKKNLCGLKGILFFCYPDPQLAEKPGAGERAGPLGQDSKKKILLGSDIRHEVGGLESNTKQKPFVFLSKS